MQFVNNTFGLSIYTDWSPENQKQFPFSVLIIAIKLLSSTFFLLKPSSKNYFEDFCSTLESAEVDFMHRIFNERSVLFLGCDLHRQEYKSFFQKFAINAKVYTTNWGDKWKFASFLLFLSPHAWNVVFSFFFFFFVVVSLLFFCSFISYGMEISDDITSNRICTKYCY